MKRPVLFMLFFLIAGIIIGRFFSAAFLPLCVLPAFLLYMRCKSEAAFLLPVLALAGFVLVQNSLSVKSPVLEAMADGGETVTINCRVTEVSTTRSDKQKITVSTSAVSGAEDTFAGEVSVQAILPEGESAKLGQYLVLTGTLMKPDFQRNPGGYDEFIYLRSRKIDYKMFPDEVTKKGVFLSPEMLVKLFRAKVAGIIDRAYIKDEAGIMKAIIIGDKSGIDDDTARMYQDAGIYHVLAVSGLHVGIIFSIVNWLLLFAGLDYKKAGYITMAVLGVYCVFTGAGVATVRAVIMSCTVIFGNIIYRDSDTLTTISLSCIILLLYEPLYLWDAGFLYSFSAVYGMNVGTKPLEKLFRNGLLRKYLSGCIAVFLASLPVSVFFFFKISWISVFINALLVPTVFLVVISGLLSVAFGFFNIALGTFFAGGAYALLSVYRLICGASLSLPFSVILTGRPPLAVLCAFYATLGLGYYALSGSGRSKRRIEVFLASASVFVILVGVSLLPPRHAEFTMLDVGQGDSTVISADGGTVIIDGGGNYLKKIGDNTGRWVVEPYLNYKGIAKADAAFLSHMDTDHALGIVELLKAKRIKKLFLADAPNGSPDLYEQILESAAESKTEIVYISAGTSVRLGGLVIDCLFPPGGHEGKDNNQSLVLLAHYGDTEFLFTGDMESAVEKELLKSGIDINAEILKIAHHGSRTSSTQGFLEAVSPETALIGVSRFNSYGHPHPSVMERLDGLNIPVYTTASDGAVTILTDGKYIKLQTMGEKNEYY